MTKINSRNALSNRKNFYNCEKILPFLGNRNNSYVVLCPFYSDMALDLPKMTIRHPWDMALNLPKMTIRHPWDMALDLPKMIIAWFVVTQKW